MAGLWQIRTASELGFLQGCHFFSSAECVSPNLEFLVPLLLWSSNGVLGILGIILTNEVVRVAYIPDSLCS